MDLFGRRAKEELFELEKKTEQELIEKENKINLLQLENTKLKSEMEKTGQLAEMQLNEKVQSLKEEEKHLDSNINRLKDKAKEVIDELGYLQDYLEVKDFGLYIPQYKFTDVLTFKVRLDELRRRQKTAIKNGTAYILSSNFTYNDSKAKGQKLLKSNAQLMLRAFNTECEAAINKVKFSNISAVEKRIAKAFIDINKSSTFDTCVIDESYLDLKLQEMRIAFEYELKKEEEKEALREQKEKEREEKALQKEIESKKKIIDKEILHLNNVIKELKGRLLKASEYEKASIEQELSNLKDNINQYENDKTELDYRIENIGAGYVYIISNIGAFGAV